MTEVDLKTKAPNDAKPVLPAVPSSEVYLEDCVKALKRFTDNHFDLAIVDPPYGLDLANMNMGAGKSKKASKIQNRKWKPKDWDKETPTTEYFKELFRVSKNQIIWGGNYFLDHLPSTRGFITWDKMVFIPTMSRIEMAWTSFNTPNAKTNRTI